MMEDPSHPLQTHSRSWRFEVAHYRLIQDHGGSKFPYKTHSRQWRIKVAHFWLTLDHGGLKLPNTDPFKTIEDHRCPQQTHSSTKRFEVAHQTHSRPRKMKVTTTYPFKTMGMACQNRIYSTPKNTCNPVKSFSTLQNILPVHLFLNIQLYKHI
jgi:hypothetical protein